MHWCFGSTITIIQLLILTERCDFWPRFCDFASLGIVVGEVVVAYRSPKGLYWKITINSFAFHSAVVYLNKPESRRDLEENIRRAIAVIMLHLHESLV